MIRSVLLGVGLCLVLVSCDSRTIEPCVGDCIPIPSGDGILAAELHLPAGSGPHPVMVLVHGSGKIERTSLNCDQSSWLSNGLALLCYDKRGVGQSSGRYRATGAGNSEEVFPTLAGDVVAVVDYLVEIRSENASDFTVEVFPNGNHELADAETGRPLDGVSPVLAWLGQVGVLG